MYQYTSLGRPLEPSVPAGRAVLYLLPIAAVLGAVMGWVQLGSFTGVLQQALVYVLVLYGSWALARELDPDHTPVAFISMAVGMLAVLLVASPGIFIVFVTLGLVRMVNRSSGLMARRTDSIIMMALAIWVIYATESPLFGLVAALAFFLDGSLKEPLRSQWVFGLICLGGMVVYMVDHDVGFPIMHWPRTLFEWISLLFIFLFALDTLLFKKFRTRGDVNGLALDTSRVRGGMTVGFLAALQGINRPEEVVIIVAAIAGLCIGMAFRKGFKAPTA
jgi:hypothetical protein